MLLGISFLVLIGGVLLLAKAKNVPFAIRGLLTVLIGVITLIPAQLSEATTTFKISNTSLTGYAKSPILVRTSGGSGSGTVTFIVSGAHCSINANAVLLASVATSCSVKATKAASGNVHATSSAVVKFVFKAASTGLHISNMNLTGEANVNFQVTSTGGVGSGAISYDTTGGTCAINADSGLLLSYGMGFCPVTVSQAASGSHKAARSPVVNFYFGPGPQDPLNVSAGVAEVVPSATAFVYAVGGSGSGAVTYSLDSSQASGSQCVVDPVTGNVTDTGHVNSVNCWVTATKAASSGYISATASTSAEVTFSLGAAGGSNTASFATPDEAFLTSVTNTSTAVTAVDDTAKGDLWFIDQYFSNPDHWLKYYVTGGSTVVLTWHVQDFSGNPIANKTVTLISNLGYSCSHGVTWSESTLNPAPSGCKVGTPMGALTGTTDGNGDVTFTLHNTNATSITSSGDMTLVGSRTAESAGHDNWSRFVLQIGSEVVTANPNNSVNEASDVVDIILLP